MRKKILFVLAASMLVMTACSSGGDEKETGAAPESEAQTTATAATTAAEDLTTAEAEQNTTEAPATTVAETETEEETTVAETPAESSIIPLFKSEYTVDDIKKISPADFNNFDNFCKYFPAETISQADDGFTICKVIYEDHIKLMGIDASINDVDYFVYGRSGDMLGGMYIETDKSISDFEDLSGYYDYSKGYCIIPLFFNEAKKCLTGYVLKDTLPAFTEDGVATYNNSDYFLVEVYYGPSAPGLTIMSADAASYGL